MEDVAQEQRLHHGAQPVHCLSRPSFGSIPGMEWRAGISLFGICPHAPYADQERGFNNFQSFSVWALHRNAPLPKI